MAPTDFSTPRLTHALVQRRSLYSLRALLMSALLGGVFGVVMMSALNSRRLARFTRDVVLYGAALALWVLSAICLRHSPLDDHDKAIALLLLRAIGGLSVFALCVRRHRPLHRAQEVTGRLAPGAGGYVGLAVILSFIVEGVISTL